MVYNKLVRDKIPTIINAQGKKANIRILADEEYLRALEAKLDEEVAEFHQDHSVEELADILEVIYALAADMGYSRNDLEASYEKKHRERGGFEQKLFLISSES